MVDYTGMEILRLFLFGLIVGICIMIVVGVILYNDHITQIEEQKIEEPHVPIVLTYFATKAQNKYSEENPECFVKENFYHDHRRDFFTCDNGDIIHFSSRESAMYFMYDVMYDK